jgi:hypothetical protein
MPLDKVVRMWYNECTERGREKPPLLSLSKVFQKTFKKPLDKSVKMWYNKNVKRNTSYR